MFFVFSCVVTKAQHTNDSTVKTNTIDSAAVIDSLLKDLQKDGLLLVPKKSYLAAGLSFLNNNVYLGRKDSVNIPYIIPDLAYYFKSGFYLEGSLSYVISSSQSRIDLATFEAGYRFTAKNYSGEATASKFFYNSQSTNVKVRSKRQALLIIIVIILDSLHQRLRLHLILVLKQILLVNLV